MTRGITIWNINGHRIEKTHLVADEGKSLTYDGNSFWHCVDTDSEDSWHEVNTPFELTNSE